jgi:hypothetical protein
MFESKDDDIEVRQAQFAAACARRAAFRAKVASSARGTAQAPLATPAADDPLGRAIERLCAGRAITTVAPGVADPLQRACDRLAGK